MQARVGSSCLNQCKFRHLSQPVLVHECSQIRVLLQLSIYEMLYHILAHVCNG